MTVSRTYLVLSALSLACYWSFFALMPFPVDLFSEVDGRTLESSFFLALVLSLCFCSAATGIAGNRGGRLSASRGALVGTFSLFLATVIVSAALKALGVVAPIPWVLAYAVLFGLYGFVLSVWVCALLAVFDNGRAALLLAFSLLLSTVIGGVVGLLDEFGVDSTTSYVMMLAAGPLCLAAGAKAPAAVRSVPDGAIDPNAPLSAGGAHGFAPSPLLLSAICVFYLIGSAAFMNISTGSQGTGWFANGWTHYGISLVLYGALILSVAWNAKRERTAIPWFAFFLLCVACLYVVALFYPQAAAFCQVIILPSRPMAFVLLWAAVTYWQRDRSWGFWTCACIVPATVLGIDLLTQLGEPLAASPEQYPTLVSAVTLVTAFAMTAGLVLMTVQLIGSLSSCASVAEAPADVSRPLGTDSHGDERSVFDEIARSHGLSKREREVMELLVQGNTQKRIAQEMVVSINSVQTYAKGLYRKLGIHSRQELIDLVQTAQRQMEAGA